MGWDNNRPITGNDDDDDTKWQQQYRYVIIKNCFYNLNII